MNYAQAIIVAFMIFTASSTYSHAQNEDVDKCETEARAAAAVKFLYDKRVNPAEVALEVGPDAVLDYGTRASNFEGNYKEFGDLIERECRTDSNNGNSVQNILNDGY